MRDQDLNRAIAEALGWRDGVTVDPEGNEYNIVVHDETEQDEYDWDALPDYCTDPGAALGLLEHCLSIKDKLNHPKFEGIIRQRVYGPWYVILCMWQRPDSREYRADADTLARAIALACLKALRASAGEKEQQP